MPQRLTETDIEVGARVRCLEPDGTVRTGTIAELPYGHLQPAAVVLWDDGVGTCYTVANLLRRNWEIVK